VEENNEMRAKGQRQMKMWKNVLRHFDLLIPLCFMSNK